MSVPDVETLRKMGFFDEEIPCSRSGMFWRMFTVANDEVRREMLRTLPPDTERDLSMGDALMRSHDAMTVSASDGAFFGYFLECDEFLVLASRFDGFGYVSGKLLLERIRYFPDNPLPSPDIFAEMAELMATPRLSWGNVYPGAAATSIDSKVLEDETLVLPAILLREYLASSRVAETVKNNADIWIPAFRRIVAAAAGVSGYGGTKNNGDALFERLNKKFADVLGVDWSDNVQRGDFPAFEVLGPAFSDAVSKAVKKTPSYEVPTVIHMLRIFENLGCGIPENVVSHLLKTSRSGTVLERIAKSCTANRAAVEDAMERLIMDGKLHADCSPFASFGPTAARILGKMSMNQEKSRTAAKKEPDVLFFLFSVGGVSFDDAVDFGLSLFRIDSGVRRFSAEVSALLIFANDCKIADIPSKERRELANIVRERFRHAEYYTRAFDILEIIVERCGRPFECAAWAAKTSLPSGWSGESSVERKVFVSNVAERLFSVIESGKSRKLMKKEVSALRKFLSAAKNSLSEQEFSDIAAGFAARLASNVESEAEAIL